MKLKKLKKSKHLFLQLQILKLFSKKKYFNDRTLWKSTEILLNKIAKIIYQYHVENKTILFLGFPEHFSKVLKNTKHILVPKFMWFNGLISNNTTFLNKPKTKLPKNLIKLILKLKKKPDLIIIYGLNDNLLALKESYLARIPAITFDTKEKSLNQKSTYSSTGSYDFFIEKSENSQKIFSFINAVVTQAKKSNKNKTNSLKNSIK